MPIQNAAVRLQQFHIFRKLGSDELQNLVSNLVEERAAAPREVLLRQGDVPGSAYLVEDGTVSEISRDARGTEIVRRRAEANDAVGLRSLMDNAPSLITARADRTCRLLVISAANFRTLLGLFPDLRDQIRCADVVNRLLAIPLFGTFAKSEVLQVAELVQEIDYEPGQVLYPLSAVADAMYVIDTGQVKESGPAAAPASAVAQATVRYLTAGSFFGHQELAQKVNRRASAEAVTHVHLFRFNADAFQWLKSIQPGFQQALTGIDVPRVLGESSLLSQPDPALFSQLNSEELSQLAGFVGLAHLRPGEALYRQGEVDPTLYILCKGEAVIRHRDPEGRERPQGYVQAGRLIGESSLFLQEPRDVTVEATTPSDWLYLTRADLEQFLAGHPPARARLKLKQTVQGRQQLRRFAWMESDEQPVRYSRRHWFYLTERLLLPLAIAGIALVATLLPAWRLFSFARAILHPLGILLLVAAGLLLLWRILNWSMDYYLLTTKRAVHRERVVLVRETLDEAPLDKITNVNISRRFWANLFGFGDILIDTATAVATGIVRVSFTYVADPAGVQAELLTQMSRVRAREHVESRRGIRDKLAMTLGESIHPVVAKPAVPSAAAPPSTKAGPGVGRRIYETLWWRWFWIEKVEEDCITWRKHWLRLVQRIWLPTLILAGLVAPAALGALLVPFVIVLWIPAVVGVGFWWWYVWRDWGNDLYSVTNDRVIDSEKKPLGLSTKSTETMFDKIQNVSFNIPHPIATLFDYGTVYIYTAGAEGKFTFFWVPHPRKVQSEIFRRITSYQAVQRRREREERMADLPEWFAAYDEARR